MRSWGLPHSGKYHGISLLVKFLLLGSVIAKGSQAQMLEWVRCEQLLAIPQHF